MSRSWYRIALLDGQAAVTVAAPGEHLGAAVDTARSRFRQAWPMLVASLGENQVPLGDSVGKGVVRIADSPTWLPPMKCPPGVVLSARAQDSPTLPTPGYTVHTGDTTTVVEAQLAGDDAADCFLAMIERLPALDNLEIRVLEQNTGEGDPPVWLSPRLDVRKALRFLDDHEVDILHNGHVYLSAYVRSIHATLRLTDHKTLVWLAPTSPPEFMFAELHRRRVPALDRLVTVSDLPHFHYRGASSSDLHKLGNRLASMRFRRVA
jgi:hypothetical protein